MATLEITDRATGAAVRPAAQQAAPAPDPVPGQVPAAYQRPENPYPRATGAMLLNETHAFLGRYIVFSRPAEHVAATLWPVHTHACDEKRQLVFESTPRLIIAGDKGCGKTLLAKLENLLCCRGKRILEPTGPALARLITELRCVLISDEMDLLIGSGQGARMVRAILNSGWQGGEVIPRANGDFETFAPAIVVGLAKVLLGNPNLDTLRDRGIMLNMAKPEPGAEPKVFRARRDAAFGQRLGAALGDWAGGCVAELATAWPELPDGLVLRGADKWEPLIAVADIAGDHWPETARAACREMTMGTNESQSVLPPRMQLLLDLREIWPAGRDEVKLSELAPLMTRRPGPCHGWSDVMFCKELPSLIGVQPSRVQSSQGYTRADLEPEWAEILPPDPEQSAEEGR